MGFPINATGKDEAPVTEEAEMISGERCASSQGILEHMRLGTT